MENLQINKDNALKAFSSADESGKSLLKALFGENIFSQKLEDRILTFEDACRENGVEAEDVLPYTEPITPDEKSINAYAKLVQIVRAFNQGKVPDWKNASQYKYYPWFRMDGKSGSGLSFADCGYGFSGTRVASRLCLLEERHAEIVAKRFQDIYSDYMTQ